MKSLHNIARKINPLSLPTVENPTRVCPVSTPVPENIRQQHNHTVAENQCCSVAVKSINAPMEKLWSMVRRFDKPHVYKHLIKDCHVISGNGGVGTVREVFVVSGVPAVSSTEILEILDDETHVMSFRVVGGEHRLKNYKSVITLHAAQPVDGGGTVVIESYVVDVPQGNTKEETCAFVDTIVKCNLHSLAQIAQSLISTI